MKGYTLIAVCLCASMTLACSTRPANEAVDDLFKDFANSGSQTTSPSSKAERYLSDIMQSIQLHMFDAKKFSGKTCDIKINLDKNGKVTSIVAEEGDPSLCEAGIRAIKVSDIPAPPDEETYQIFKASIIKFKPL